MNTPTIVKCPKCGEQLVFTENGHSELNYNFVEERGEARKYIWPQNITTFAQEPSNSRKLKQLRAERTEAVKSGNRRVEIHRQAVLTALLHTHRGDFKRLSVDLDTPLTLTCICGEAQIVGGADEIC